MSDVRPTFRSAQWTVTGFLDGLFHLLDNNDDASQLRLYFYAVTLDGWAQIKDRVAQWRGRRAQRSVVAYVGTDHGLTDPLALHEMEGITVRLLRRYNGIYHPKVVWFWNRDIGDLLVGSNNLTFDGLRNNIEFATITRLGSRNAQLIRWHDSVHDASDELTDELLESYEDERQKFGKARAQAGVAGTFTWSKRSSTTRKARPGAGVEGPPEVAPPPPGLGEAQVSDLILEIMPLETGVGGSQIQIPMQPQVRFLGCRGGRMRASHFGSAILRPAIQEG